MRFSMRFAMRFPAAALPYLLWAGALSGCQPDTKQQATAATGQPAVAAPDSAPPEPNQRRDEPAPRGPVKIVTVAAGPAGETYGRFELPQVQLPDAALAGRLNRAIVAAAASFEGGADWAGLSGQQAVQRCLREYQQNDQQGLTSLSYSVVYNENGLLTLAQISEYMGAYPSSDTRAMVFDVRAGRRLTMADLVRDTTALRNAWRAKISQRVSEFLRDAPKNFADDPDLAQELPQLLHWNAATRQVAFDAHEPRFYDFAVTPRGLTLTYSFGFPHVIQAAEPERDYSFTYAELRPLLRPDGPLAPLLK